MALVVCRIHRATLAGLAILHHCQRLDLLLQHLHLPVVGSASRVVHLELANRLLAVLGAQEFVEIGGFGTVARKFKLKYAAVLH